MYLLDTNVLSAIRRPDCAPQVRVWLAACPDEDLYCVFRMKTGTDFT